MTERVDRTERLLNLVICLMASRAPVPRAEIRTRIPGYDSAASDAAFERMFERDKDELRSMGIPVETILDAGGEVQGYRIPPEHYSMPAIDLTAAERAAVAVAAQVWSEAAIAAVPGTALRKLEATGLSWSPAGVRGSVSLRAEDAALLPLLSAVRQERVVSFDYRAPAEQAPGRRTVSPWGLRSADGRWFLVGHDHDRDAVRTFRLSRIVGQVTVSARPREVSPPDDFDVSLPTDAAEGAATARVRLAPGRAASLRRMAIPEGSADPLADQDVLISAPTHADLVAAVCAAGPDAVVLEPPAVVDDVLKALRAVLGNVGGPR